MSSSKPGSDTETDRRRSSDSETYNRGVEKKVWGYFAGLILVVLGAVTLLENLDLIGDLGIEEFYPLVFVIYGLYWLAVNLKSDRQKIISPIIIIGIGLIWQLDKLDIDVSEITGPAFLIAIGIYIILKKLGENETERNSRQ